MASKDSLLPIAIGGGILAVILMNSKKPIPKSTKTSEPQIDVTKPKDEKPVEVEQPFQQEKEYLDFYYNTALYKISQIDTEVFGMPAEYKYLGTKGSATDAEWLTNIAYWALYSAPNNASGEEAPWKITDPNDKWYKVYTRMYNYAKTLFGTNK